MSDSAWLTTAEAIARASCSDRKLQRLVRDGLLEARIRPGKPTLYSAEGIAALASAPRTVHRPAVSPANGNGNGHAALARRDSLAGEADLQVGLLRIEVVHVTPTGGPTGPTGPTPVSHPLCLTLEQAEREAGVPAKELRRLIRTGELKPICGRSSRTWRLAWRDLEARWG